MTEINLHGDTSIDATSSVGSELVVNQPGSPNENGTGGNQNSANTDNPPTPEKVIEPATPAATLPATPAATPAATPTAAPVQTDDIKKHVESALKEIFGDEVTPEQAKQFVASVPGLKKQLEDAEKNKVKFATPEIEALNRYIAQGGTREVFDRVQKIDLANLKGLDAIKALYAWENPELTEKQIEIVLADKYNQREVDTAEDKELGLTKALIDSKEALKKLTQIKTENSVPPAERDRLQEEQSEKTRIESWSPVAKKIVSDIVSVPVLLEEKDATGKIVKTETFNYTGVTPEVMKLVDDDVRNTIELLGVPYTKEAVDDIKQYALERVIARDWKNIINAVATQAATEREKRVRAEYTNNNAPPSGGQSPVSGKVKSASDAQFEKQMARMEGKEI